MKEFFLRIIIVVTFLTALFLSGHAQYPFIRIADVQVTPNNQDNITSSYILGTVRYDSTSRTLSFNNATVLPYQIDNPDIILGGNSVVILCGRNSVVNIVLIGDNEISGSQPLMVYEGNFNIIGSGSLTLNSTWFEGVNCEIDVPSFTISRGADVSINVPPNSPFSGFAGSTGNYAHTIFEMDSSSLTVNAPLCFQSIEGFQLHGCYISLPEGAFYDHDSLSLVASEGVVRNNLEIRPGNAGVQDYHENSRFAWGVMGGILVKSSSRRNCHVEVLNLLGQTIFKSLLDEVNMFLPIRPGVYIVQVGNTSTKVAVY